ncbi:MAG TPA: hypothetical protein VHN79_11195, partial [Lacunisphaera sp.]|nr:hypothetical protein [Lacunisphaera sp.]
MSVPAASRVRGEVESPRPLRAPSGRIALKGWCLLPGQSTPPLVRLLTESGTLLAATGLPRSDVPALLPAERAAAR